jgi:hypothetical protein
MHGTLSKPALFEPTAAFDVANDIDAQRKQSGIEI